MTITRLGHGAYADVLDMTDGTVVKAYRREAFGNGPVQDWRDHDALTRGFFEAEASTYERLSDHLSWHSLETTLQVPVGEEGSWVARLLEHDFILAAGQVIWCPI